MSCYITAIPFAAMWAKESSFGPKPGLNSATGCCVCDQDQVHSSGCGQHSTDLLAHLGFKRIVPCCFHNKRMHLKNPRLWYVHAGSLMLTFFQWVIISCIYLYVCMVVYDNTIVITCVICVQGVVPNHTGSASGLNHLNFVHLWY